MVGNSIKGGQPNTYIYTQTFHSPGLFEAD